MRAGRQECMHAWEVESSWDVCMDGKTRRRDLENACGMGGDAVARSNWKTGTSGFEGSNNDDREAQDTKGIRREPAPRRRKKESMAIIHALLMFSLYF